MVQWTSWAFRDGAKMEDNAAYGITQSIARDASASVHLEVLRLYDKTSSDEEKESDDEETDSDDNQANCDYEALLEDTLDIAGIKESRSLPEFHPTSAILRTYLQLAVVIVHEFAHAFNIAYYVRQPGEIHVEPWVAGDSTNDYNIYYAAEGFLDGELYNSTKYHDTISDQNEDYMDTSNIQQSLQHNTSQWQRLSNVECIAAYAVDLTSSLRDLVAVVPGPNTTNSSLLYRDAYHFELESELVDDAYGPYQWVCEDP
ncbi:hypothetical protein E4T38_00234 [Aureobasidium subglaciale]|nr:hypothetical protein E4T38_00234 [Aureobasidium subglaciale]KAI5232355.1 hypothetical protein E4T40_00233 [Aureobasidium subglaciale]KAI5234636.1 hypothetical protein E4T41_00233 [Aureobasidium subglaciale]KAI5268451.1 hypothetical protein E4T46_00233 [Aureobasidium subglaciale]